MRAALTTLVILAIASPASAYNRTQVPGANPGPAIAWCSRAVPYVVNEKGSKDAGAAASIAAVQRSFATWNAPACTDFRFDDHGTTARTDVGYNPAATDNLNLVVWREAACSAVVPKGDSCLVNGGCNNLYDCWDLSSASAAVTTTTFNNKTGELYDADIELNGVNFVFTVADGATCPNPPARPSIGCVATDVQNTVTHEAGHIVGLDHTTAPDSTMYAIAPLGEVKKRALDQDTIDGECAIYPKGQDPSLAPECQPRPDAGTPSKSDAGQCISETDHAFCTRLDKNCGRVSGVDNCGASRTVPTCGSCPTGACGGGGTQNVCGDDAMPDGGTAPGKPSTGCGCAATTGLPGAWVFLLALFGYRRRRGSPKRRRA